MHQKKPFKFKELPIY